jgi:putative acetyltransferase
LSGGRIAIDDPSAADVRALLARHLAFARATTRPEDVYALEVDELLDPAVTFFSYRAGGAVLGVAALKRIDDEHAEIKSMHTAEEARGQGIARALVEHVVGVARERGYRRLSLETGAGPAFEPARRLYASAGFEPCGPFGDYRPSPNSAFMTRALDAPASAARSRGASPGRR